MKLSPAQLRMLETIAAGRSPFFNAFTPAEVGGATGTLRSLMRRKLVERELGVYRLTDAGRAALEEK